jgi:hypothetical protein
VTEYGATQVDLPTYLRQYAPLPPQNAALLAAGLAEQLAALHAAGRVHGPLDSGVYIDVPGGQPPQAVLVDSGTRRESWQPADDVLGVGVILLHLLGGQLSPEHRLPPQPATVPDPLWSLITGCLRPDPAARPTAAALAQQLRGAARDLLLGVAPWGTPNQVPGPAPDAQGFEPLVPGYVPGPAVAGLDDPATPPNRRGRLLVVAAAAAAVVLATVGVVFALTGSSDERSPVASDRTASTEPAPPPTEATTPPSDPTTPPATPSATPSKKPRTPTRSPSHPASVPPAPAVPAAVCLQPGCIARVTFEPRGARFTVCDNNKDGFSAIGVYTRSDAAGERMVWASGSVGTCESAALGMPRGAKITFKACIGEHDKNTVTACSDPVTGTA